MDEPARDEESLTLEDLPESSREIGRLIGLDGVRLLSHRFGGAKFTVPASTRRSRLRDWLTETLGEERARSLLREYLGEVIYVPNLRNALAKARNRVICRRWDRI